LACVQEKAPRIGLEDSGERFRGLKPKLSLDGVFARVHASREGSLEGVDTLLLRCLRLRFLLLLLLRSSLCCLLLGRLVGLPLLCTTHHGPRSGSSACSFARVIVSNRPDRGTSGCAPGSTPYTPSSCLFGIVRGGLLLGFLLFLSLGWWGRSLRVDARLLFG
jgi:hypothetical protein